MSDQHPLLSAANVVGEIEHTHFLASHIGSLHLNDDYSDIIIIVEGERFKCHKVILAARSEYFRALLYGGMKESRESEIHLKNTSLAAFRALLQYIYTGKMSLNEQREEEILDILGLAHLYGFGDLEEAVSDYLKAILSIQNVCVIYGAANLYTQKKLESVCLSFMDCHAQEIMHQESFLCLSSPVIKEILCRDSFCAPEVTIFKAVCDWVKANPDENSDEILSCIRLPLISLSDLLNVVRPTGLVSADTMLDAIKLCIESKSMDLKHRGFLLPEENVARSKLGAAVLVGEMKQALLDGDCQNYDMERGFTRHAIDDLGTGIVVKLGMPCIVNHMKLLLWDRDMRSYSYYIEVSMDGQDWVRVIDHSLHHCRSWQRLFFHPHVIQYVRIVGTNNTVNRVFHVVHLEVMYTKMPFTLDKGLLVPAENMATTEMKAIVIEGVSRSRNALLNGDTVHYDWDSGYTCHQLGTGAIVVQLSQPYMLESMRLLLWDCDDRSYSYYIEVSVNHRDWDLVCDKTRIQCKSWQTVYFPRRPVVFIRIVGTHNTANEVFHCVHFECPAQVPPLTSPMRSAIQPLNLSSPMMLPHLPAVTLGSADGSEAASQRDRMLRQNRRDQEIQDMEALMAARNLGPMAGLAHAGLPRGEPPDDDDSLPDG